MMPLCYKAAREREQFMCNLVAGMRQTTPEEARTRIMIGDKQECLDTIERYRKPASRTSSSCSSRPYFQRRDPGVRRGGHPGGAPSEALHRRRSPCSFG